MEEAYLVIFWAYKKVNLGNNNDDVEILGIYKNLENAYEFVNSRFSYFLADNQRELSRFLFPTFSKRNLINYCLTQHFDQYLTDKIMSHLYSNLDRAVKVGDNCPNKKWDNEVLRIEMESTNCFHQLMKLHQWLSNSETPFPDFCELPIIINEEVHGLLRRISSETCRLRLFDSNGREMRQSFYLGNNLIDLEDCYHRETHFCSSFRIYTKMIRD